MLPSNSTDFTQAFFDRILFLDDANDGIDQNIEDAEVNQESLRKLTKRDLGFLSRRNLYQTIEGKLEMHGFNGRECLMKMICEAETSDFVQTNGYLGNLIQILLKYGIYINSISDLTYLICFILSDHRHRRQSGVSKITKEPNDSTRTPVTISIQHVS